MKEDVICLAIEQAKKSGHSCFKHGAVLLHGKHVVSFGHNTEVTKNNIFPSLHAEMAAIKNAKNMRIKKKSTPLCMVVIRINKSGYLRFSKPCYNCQHIMKTNGIEKCCYSTENGKIDTIYL